MEDNDSPICPVDTIAADDLTTQGADHDISSHSIEQLNISASLPVSPFTNMD